MKLEDIISSALPLAEKWAPSQAPRLHSVRKQLEAETLKITVLGDFKAGKSTLLNHMFLQSNLLPTEVAESTAVPTVLCNGNPALQLWKRDAHGMEHLVETMDGISAAQLVDYITAGTEAQRLELSRRYSKAVVSLPGILPEGMCIVDTPGMNSTNVGIVTASLWEAHDADAVLYVVRARQLSQREIELIEEISGSQRNKIPFFVVLTSDGTQSAGQLQMICSEIRAELSMRQIPCECGAFYFPPQASIVDCSVINVAQRLKQLFVTNESQIVSTAAGNHIIIDSPGDVSNVWMQRNDELKSQLLDFFGRHVGLGRRAKVVRNTLPVLDEIRNAVQCRLALGDADAARLEQAREQLEYKKSEYERTISCLLGDVCAAQKHFIQLSAAGIDRVKEQLKEELNEKKKVDDIFAEMQLWKHKIPRCINQEIETASLVLEKDLQKLRAKYEVSVESQMSHAGGYDVRYDAGLVDHIPAWMITLIDYLAFDLLSPLPFFADLGVRYLISNIPLLDKLTPAYIAANIARDIACRKLDEIAAEVHNNVRAGMESRFAMLNTRLTSDLGRISPFAGEEDALSVAAVTALSPQERQELLSASAELNIWTEKLNGL